MTPSPCEVMLIGAWPVGITAELEAVLGKLARVSDTEVTARQAMIPWTDLASLVSAGAAAIMVALSIWDIRRPARTESDEKPDIEALDAHVKQQGIFGIEIDQIAAEPGPSRRMTIRVLHEISGRQFEFELTQTGEQTTARIVESE